MNLINSGAGLSIQKAPHCMLPLVQINKKYQGQQDLALSITCDTNYKLSMRQGQEQ